MSKFLNLFLFVSLTISATPMFSGEGELFHQKRKREFLMRPTANLFDISPAAKEFEKEVNEMCLLLKKIDRLNNKTDKENKDYEKKHKKLCKQLKSCNIRKNKAYEKQLFESVNIVTMR